MKLRVVLVPRAFGLPRRYWISAIAHVALLAGWAFAPTRTTRFEFKGDAMTVGLVAAPPSGGGARAVAPPTPTPPAPSPPEPAPPPESKGPSLQEEKKPAPKEKKETKKKEEAPPTPAPSPPNAFEADSARSSQGPSAPGSGAGGAGAPGTTLSLGAGQPGADFYSATVRAAIEPRWRKPVLDQGGASEVTVSFEILRDGTVQNVRVIRPSGIPSLDRSAMGAVIDASPLPPFPAGWRGASTPATMTFILLPE